MTLQFYFLGDGSLHLVGVDPFYFDRKPFKIMNIYTSNHGPERYTLWWWFTLSLPQTIWLLYGDFNMIEKSNDKVDCLPIRWCIKEWEA